MWQCSGVLSISERNLYNDLGLHVCKKYTILKLQALRQCSEVISISERNFRSAQSLDMCICTLVKCIYLSFFLFFYVDIMTASILRTVQNSVILPSCLQERSQMSKNSCSMFSGEPFLCKNKICSMIALNCFQASRGNLQ